MGTNTALAPLSIPELLRREPVRNNFEAEALLLSPTLFSAYCDELLRIAPNPFEQGRINQVSRWKELLSEKSGRMVWC